MDKREKKTQNYVNQAVVVSGLSILKKESIKIPCRQCLQQVLLIRMIKYTQVLQILVI